MSNLGKFIAAGRHREGADVVRPDQVVKGVKVEREHTSGMPGDPRLKALLQTKITMDHLSESPRYYTDLKAMEDKADERKTKQALFNSFGVLQDAVAAVPGGIENRVNKEVADLQKDPGLISKFVKDTAVESLSPTGINGFFDEYRGPVPSTLYRDVKLVDMMLKLREQNPKAYAVVANLMMNSEVGRKMLQEQALAASRSVGIFKGDMATKWWPVAAGLGAKAVPVVNGIMDNFAFHTPRGANYANMLRDYNSIYTDGFKSLMPAVRNAVTGSGALELVAHPFLTIGSAIGQGLFNFGARSRGEPEADNPHAAFLGNFANDLMSRATEIRLPKWEPAGVGPKNTMFGANTVGQVISPELPKAPPPGPPVFIPAGNRFGSANDVTRVKQSEDRAAAFISGVVKSAQSPIAEDVKEDKKRLRRALQVAGVATGVGGLSYLGGKNLVTPEGDKLLHDFAGDVESWQRGGMAPDEVLRQYLRGASMASRTNFAGVPGARIISGIKSTMGDTVVPALEKYAPSLHARLMKSPLKAMGEWDDWAKKHYEAYEQGPIFGFLHYLRDNALLGDDRLGETRTSGDGPVGHSVDKMREAMGDGDLLSDFGRVRAERQLNRMWRDVESTVPVVPAIRLSKMYPRLKGKWEEMAQVVFKKPLESLSVDEQMKLYDKMDIDLRKSDPTLWSQKKIFEARRGSEVAYKPVYRQYGEAIRAGDKIRKTLMYGIPAAIGLSAGGYALYQLYQAAQERKRRAQQQQPKVAELETVMSTAYRVGFTEKIAKAVNLQQYMAQAPYRELSPDERTQIDEGSSQVIPRIFTNPGTPIPELMHSPGWAAGLGGAVGAAGGGLLGALLGEGTDVGATAGGVGGAGIGGLLAALLAYKSTQNSNQGLVDFMHRLPKGDTRMRGIMADPVVQANQDRMASRAQAAALAALAISK